MGMWDWVSDVVGDVVETIGETSWTSTLMDSAMTSVVGAGIGALATAVTGGDITEGLLYGAAGGLVSGGLASFGSQFSDNWSLASTMNDTATGGFDSYGGLAYGETDSGEFTSGDKSILASAGLDLGDSSTTAGKTAAQIAEAGNSGKAWWDPSGVSEGGAQLILGGASMLGNLLDDSDTSTEMQAKVYQDKLDYEKEKLGNRKTALANFDIASNDYTPSTSVREIVSDKNVGFSKNDSGVNLG